MGHKTCTHTSPVSCPHPPPISFVARLSMSRLYNGDGRCMIVNIQYWWNWWEAEVLGDITQCYSVPHIRPVLLIEWMVFTFILLSFCFQFHMMCYFNCFRFFFFCGGYGGVHWWIMCIGQWSAMSSSWQCDYGLMIINVSRFQVHLSNK